MSLPIYATRPALADLAALDAAQLRAVVAFLRELQQDPRPTGAVQLGEGILKKRIAGGCLVYWDDPAIRGKLTLSRVFRLPPV